MSFIDGVVVGVDRRRRHLPLAAVDRLADLRELAPLSNSVGPAHVAEEVARDRPRAPSSRATLRIADLVAHRGELLERVRLRVGALIQSSACTRSAIASLDAAAPSRSAAARVSGVKTWRRRRPCPGPRRGRGPPPRRTPASAPAAPARRAASPIEVEVGLRGTAPRGRGDDPHQVPAQIGAQIRQRALGDDSLSTAFRNSGSFTFTTKVAGAAGTPAAAR